jgi:hypothetical protein
VPGSTRSIWRAQLVRSIRPAGPQAAAGCPDDAVGHLHSQGGQFGRGCERISATLVTGPALPASPGAVARALREAGYELEETPTRPHPEHARSFERARPNRLWQAVNAQAQLAATISGRRFSWGVSSRRAASLRASGTSTGAAAGRCSAALLAASSPVASPSDAGKVWPRRLAMPQRMLGATRPDRSRTRRACGVSCSRRGRREGSKSNI